MKLRIKIILVVLPIVAAGIIFLGFWTIRSSDRFFCKVMLDILAKDLEVYVTATLPEIYAGGVADDLAEPQAILQRQQEAFAEAEKKYVLETGHIFIISSSGHLVFCSRGYAHPQCEEDWLPVVKMFADHKMLPLAQQEQKQNFTNTRDDGSSPQQEGLGAIIPVTQEILKGNIRMLQGQALVNGEEALYVATYFQPWDWLVVATISKQELNSAISGLRWATFLVSAATIIAAFFLICLAMRYFIIRPIAMLQEAAVVITGHGHVERVAVDSTDELGSLARSMEVLSVAQRRYHEYQAEWQEQLEQKVTERTSALQASNDALNKEIFERHKANKQFERLLYTLDQTLDSVFMFRADNLHFSYVNRGAMDQLGYRGDELLAMTPVDLKPDFTEAAFRVMLAPLISGEKKFLNFETVHQHRDGHLIPVEIFLQYVEQEEDEALFVSIVRDIRSRKEAEAEKRDLERKLQQAHKMEAVGTLAGGIAHDFNNILASIIGFAELAQDQVDSKSPVQGDLDQILVAGRRAKELVKQILAFSRQTNEEKLLVYPHHIIKETVRILRATLPSSVEISTAISDQCAKILADPTQIHQVLLNLCINGVHAMAEKGKLTIGLREVELRDDEVSSYPGVESGQFFCLSVTDTGSGISDSDLKRIFDPFFTTKGVGEGTGMGLAMVHGIVEDHGGMIQVASAVGHGTTFKVFFPAAQDEEEGADAKVPVEEEALALSGAGHLLVVDDEDAILSMYKRSLEPRGYKVTTAQNGQSALELFRAKPDDFDLLLTDQTMPSMTGTELVQEVLLLRSDLPVILCSGYSSSIDATLIHELGVRRYLYKPMDLKLLAKEIRDILGAPGDNGKA